MPAGASIYLKQADAADVVAVPDHAGMFYDPTLGPAYKTPAGLVVPFTGTPGKKGAPGREGRVGERGPRGPKGRDGTLGTTGPAGVQGPSGRRGPPGKDGARGERGPRGQKGKDGSSGSGGSSGLVLLGVYSASAGSSIDVFTRNQGSYTGAVFQSDFKKYKLETDEITTSASAHVFVKAGYGVTPTIDGAANYEWGMRGRTSNGAEAVDDGYSVTGTPARLFVSLSTNAGYGFGVATITIHNPLTASKRRVLTGEVEYVNTLQVFGVWGMVWTDLTNPMTAIQLAPASGNITGTVRLYALAS